MEVRILRAIRDILKETGKEFTSSEAIAKALSKDEPLIRDYLTLMRRDRLIGGTADFVGLTAKSRVLLSERGI